MPISDILKKFRGAEDGKEEATKGEDESLGTPRLIKLTDEEQKAFEGSKPGSDLTCTVHGNLDGDGMFRVMSVSAPEGMKYSEQGEKDMAGQVAQKVNPMIQPSVS